MATRALDDPKPGQLRRHGPERPQEAPRRPKANLDEALPGSSVTCTYRKNDNQFTVEATVVADQPYSHRRVASYDSLDRVAAECWGVVCEMVGVDAPMPELQGKPDEPPPEPERRVHDPRP